MIKKFIPSYLFLICLLFLQSSKAEAQMTMADYLTRKFQKYCSEVPREEAYVNTDRDEYISGENMWFTAFIFDRQSQELSDRSSIIYLELLNADNRPVIQKRIGMNNGVGPGQITLPDTLTSGTYILRAYTSWMKNFLPVNCFVKNIKIWNALNSKRIEGREIITGNVTDNVHVLSSMSADRSISFDLKDAPGGLINLVVASKKIYRDGNNSLIYLFIQTHGRINYVKTEQLSGDTTIITVPGNLITPGINQITLFNLKGQPVCEKYKYTPAIRKQNLIINTVDNTGKRSRVSVDMLIKSAVTLNKSAKLSVAVKPVDKQKIPSDIENYLVLGTEFGIMDPAIYLDSEGDIVKGKIDSLLLSLHSNWIDWNRIMASSQKDFKYPFEKDFHYLYGTLLGNKDSSRVSGKYIFLSVPGKTAVFNYARTDDEGNFNFALPVDGSLKNLIIQSEYYLPGQNISIESPFSGIFMAGKKSADSAVTAIPSYVSDWGTAYQVRKIYSVHSSGKPLPAVYTPIIPKRFYGKPEVEIKMADYIKLPVMQEVFFELVPGAFLKEKDSKWEITLSDPVNNTIYSHPPLLMIDGVIIKDASVIAGLDPEVVEKIDVEREKYMVGDYMFYGAVNIITHAGDFSNGTLPDDAVSYPYRVLDPVSSFVSPDYSSAEAKSSRIPDFRTTLYWNPSVSTDKDGKASFSFWTSDLNNDYEINIQGVNSDGDPVSISKRFKVQ